MTLKHIAAAVALTLATTAALADDQNITLAQTGPGTFAAAFSTTETLSGLFVDTFTFSLPATFSGLLGSGALTFASMSGPVSLVVASLDAANGISVASPADADTIAFPSSLAYSGAMAPLTLTVLGFAGDPFADPTPVSARYGGSITFNAAVAAVPEPETYGLMLAGLAAIGYASRKRLIKRT
jgi:hypothetical protein